MEKDETVVSFAANKKWLSIPKDVRSMLEKNVWCGSCSDAVMIKDYIVEESPAGLVLRGHCNKCGHKVARVID